MELMAKFTETLTTAFSLWGPCPRASYLGECARFVMSDHDAPQRTMVTPEKETGLTDALWRWLRLVLNAPESWSLSELWFTSFG